MVRHSIRFVLCVLLLATLQCVCRVRRRLLVTRVFRRGIGKVGALPQGEPFVTLCGSPAGASSPFCRRLARVGRLRRGDVRAEDPGRRKHQRRHPSPRAMPSHRLSPSVENTPCRCRIPTGSCGVRRATGIVTRWSFDATAYGPAQDELDRGHPTSPRPPTRAPASRPVLASLDEVPNRELESVEPEFGKEAQ